MTDPRRSALTTLVGTCALIVLAACGVLNRPHKTENRRVHEFFESNGVRLPLSVRGSMITPTGLQDIGQASILLHHTAASPRRLIVLIHGWGGNTIGTWGQLPLLLLNVGGVSYDLFIYGYPTRFHSGTGLKDAADRLLNSLEVVIQG